MNLRSNETWVGHRVLKPLNDEEYPGLNYFLIFFACLFALMWYLLGCFGRPVVPS